MREPRELFEREVEDALNDVLEPLRELKELLRDPLLEPLLEPFPDEMADLNELFDFWDPTDDFLVDLPLPLS